MPRVLVRGAGSIGTRHARVFAGLGCDVTVWPVTDRSRDVADEMTWVRDVEGSAALARADVVVVATDTARHVDDALEALDAGAPTVLVEKPLAATLADAARLTGHPRAEAVWVAAPLRAMEGLARLREVITTWDCPLGLSAHVWSQSWLPDWRPWQDYRESYSARADEGGVLRDLVHELDYVALLFGAPSVAGARLEHAGPLDIGAEQAATLLLDTASASVTMRLDYITRPPSRGIVVRGPVGWVEWIASAHLVRRGDPSGGVETWHVPEDGDRDARMADQALAMLQIATASADVADGAGLSAAPASLAHGLEVVRLCDDARAWARTTIGTDRTGPA